jgi:hypothetical protein
MITVPTVSTCPCLVQEARRAELDHNVEETDLTNIVCLLDFSVI